MPVQRRNAVQDFLQMMIKNHLAANQQEQEDELIRSRQRELAMQNARQRLLDSVAGHPEVADRFAAAGLDNVMGVPLAAFRLTPDQNKAAAGKYIGDASDLQHLPDAETVAAQFNGVDRPTIESLIAARRNSIASGMAPTKRTQYDPATGATMEDYVPSDPTKLTAMGPVQTTPTAAQKGRDEGVTEETKAPFDVRAKNQIETGTRAEKVRTAGQTSAAQAGGAAAATAAYHPTMLEDDSGNAVPVVFGPKGGQVADMPEGLHRPGYKDPNAPQHIPATTVTNIAVGNNAELQGVRVLTALRKAGLDQSNDPMDPRWTQFLIGTLKVAPQDVAAMDINQRTNYIDAVLMKTLLGGRPNKTLQDLYSKHLPQATQTGKLLYHQLQLALGEGRDLRKQYREVYGDAVKDPVGGMTLDQFEQSAGADKMSPLDSGLSKLAGRK